MDAWEVDDSAGPEFACICCGEYVSGDSNFEIPNGKCYWMCNPCADELVGKIDLRRVQCDSFGCKLVYTSENDSGEIDTNVINIPCDLLESFGEVL